jgi:hypothetical protein
MMIFMGKSIRYPDVDPWFISATGFRFLDTYRKAARKALRRLRVVYKHHLQRAPMGFFPPTGERGRSWIAQMRGLGREEEDIEDTVSHLSIYLTGLDELYREQMAQLKYQIRRAEKAIQEMEEQRTRAVRAEFFLATLQAQWQDHEAHRGIGGWIEEEPEETHWDRGTQTEDDVMEQCLPPKKRPIQIEEESP